MLQAQGISARYVVGNISVPSDQVMNWLGVKDIDLAVSAMQVAGIPMVALSSDGTYVNFEHVWVEASVDYQSYRGGSPLSWYENSVQNWISLDPSFKLKAYTDSSINATDSVSFDYNTYYNALFKKSSEYSDKNPLEIYQDALLDYLHQNHTGNSLQDLGYNGSVIQQNNKILQASLPYLVIGTPRRYDSIAEHDNSGTEPRPWRKYLGVSLTIQGNKNNFNFLVSQLPMQELVVTSDGIQRRYNCEYSDCDCDVCCEGSYECTCSGNMVEALQPVESLVLRSGQSVVGVANGACPKYNPSSNTLTPPPSTTTFDINLSYVDYVADYPYTGGYTEITYGAGREFTGAQFSGTYLILFGDQSSNWSQFEDAANQTLGSQAPVDLLQTAGTFYMARVNDEINQINALSRTKTFGQVFLGTASCLSDIEYVDGTPFSVTPGGLLIDITVNGSAPYGIDSSGQIDEDMFKLLAHSASASEHEVWQELIGYDAISTVRGFQMALAQGAALKSYSKSNVSAFDNLNSVYGTSFINGLQTNINTTASDGNSLTYTLPNQQVDIPSGNFFAVFMGQTTGNKVDNRVPNAPLYSAESYEMAIYNTGIFYANGGYIDSNSALKKSGEPNSVAALTSPVYNSAIFSDVNLISQVNNDRIVTPSTSDPVSTVTGNNYHDETDIVIKGRGLNIALTRTYNSAPVSTGSNGPLGYGWTHSYNMRLRSNDYGSCPSCPPGTGQGERTENGDGITSSITYFDERGGEHNYLVSGGTISPPRGEFDKLVLNDSSSGMSSGYL